MHDKNDKWLKNLRDKMEGFEMDTPDGLWECLDRQHINPIGEPEEKKQSGRWIIPHWIKYGVAASLLAIISVSVYHAWNSHTSGNESMEHHLSQNGPAEHVPKSHPEPDFTTEAAECFNHPTLHNTISATAICPQQIGSKQNTADLDNVNTISNDETERTVTGDTSSIQAAEPVRNNPDQWNRPLHYAQTGIHRHRDSNGHFTIGISSTGGISSNRITTSHGDASVSSAGPGDAQWSDDPRLGILLFNKDKETKSRVHHRQPIRTTLSIGYRFNDRLSVETGLTYSNLTSDIKEGSENHYFTGEQTLHYLGLPISMRYEIAGWKRLHLYAAGGILIEKNVSGETRRDYILNDKKEKTETEKINESPLQWSLSLTPGAEVNITKNLGLFVEPGVSYYIDNKSPVKNIYKEKPLNFNLNFGLRLTIGK